MSPESKKFLLSALDRVMFIAIGAAGTIATSYITGIMKLNPPELVAEQSFATIDQSLPVPNQVGNLHLDYQADAPLSYGIYRVDIANEGRGPAENVRFQVKMPATLAAAYEVEPDLKVYSPSSMSFGKNEFYAELAHFPSGARDFVAFRITGDASKLSSSRVKLVNDDYEGRVEGF